MRQSRLAFPITLVFVTAATVALVLGSASNPGDDDSSSAGFSILSRAKRNSRGRSRLQQTPSTSLGAAAASNSTVPPTSTSTRLWRGSKKVKALPNDASTRHPVSLLHEMQLDPKFEILHCSEDWKGVKVQSMKATLSFPKLNRTFGPAYGRNKKQAKKRVAEEAVKALYNITFDDPTPMTDQHHNQHLEICNAPMTE